MNRSFMFVSRSILTLSFCTAAAMAQPSTLAGQNQGKISLCHAAGGKFTPVSVNLNALDTHIAHGDVIQPNGVVPGSPGFVFDSNCVPVTWTFATNTPPDVTAEDPAHPGTLYVGSGIPATNFGIVRSQTEGLELGLMLLYRQGPTISTIDDYTDGVLNFNVASGPQSTANGSAGNNANRAAWNFTWSIVTGLNGPSNLTDHTFRILYDVDPGPGVSYHTLVMEQATPPAPPLSGFVWREQSTGIVVVADDEGTSQVTQNSENYAFGLFQAFLTAPYGPGNSFAGPGKFDIILQALSGSQIVASNHIVVNVAP